MRSFALFIALACAGCTVGEGAGSVVGSVWLNQCTSTASLGSQAAPQAFNLNPTYFVALPTNDIQMLEPMNHLTIRVQSAGNALNESDLIYFTVEDQKQVAAQLGQPITVGPSTNLRATLGLFRTCPQASVQLELDGTVTFSRFGAAAAATPSGDFQIQFGDPLTATFSFDLIDRRALTLGGVGAVTGTPDAGGHLDGNFDFRVAQGRSAQPF